MKTRRFPAYLLQRPGKERMSYFKSVVIKHPKLDAALERVLEEIDRADEGDIICIYGPTGVGKSTLFRLVMLALIQRELAEMKRDAGYIPVAGTELLAPEMRAFDWTDLYVRSLKALAEPLIDRKRNPKLWRARNIDKQAQAMIRRRRFTRRDLRSAFENAIRYRRLRIFMYDEAHHLMLVADPRSRKGQLETIKSLASTTRVVFALFGTYLLLDLTNESGQLGRRTVDVHFPRYRADDPQEVAQFKTILRMFQRELPLSQEPNLMAHWQRLYVYSAGCVGVLKQVLCRILQLALKRGDSTITESHVEACAPTQRKLLKMAQEIDEGEQELETSESVQVDINRLLGLTPRGDSTTANFGPHGSSRGRTARKPGDRNPHRDQIGPSTGQAAAAAKRK